MLNVPQNIKDILHEDSCPKNIRIHFPNGERSDICNNLIVKDSVSFTESLCSQDELKFGLCEASVFECETVGVGNIKGATIEVTCEIFCDASVSGAEYKPDLMAYVYPIPYGVFIVKSCQRQGDMAHRRIIAYGGFEAVYQYENAIQKVRDNYGLETATAYNPNLFNICLELLGIKDRLPNATYTDFVYPGYIYTEQIMYTYAYQERTGMSDFFNVICKLFLLPENAPPLFDTDILYYADMPEASKSVSEIMEELSSEYPNRKWFYDMILSSAGDKWTGCGLGIKPWDDIRVLWQLELQICKFQDGHYIYPYQYCEGFDKGIYKWGSPRTEYHYNPAIAIPYAIEVFRATSIEGSRQYYQRIQFRNPDDVNCYKVELDSSVYPSIRKSFPRNRTEVRASLNGNVTYYLYDSSNINYLNLLSAMEELKGYFGRLKRDYLFEQVSIKRQFNLNPSSELYPGSATYPQGVTGGKLLPEDYRSCWYDDEYTKPFGAIVCQYKNTNDEDCVFTLYLTGYSSETDTNAYKVYDLSGNEIIRDSLWTQAQIQTICNALANNISGVSYMPVDFVGRGLPYVETGDTFEILTRSNDSITTIVLNRTLTGEQVLVDSYKSV